MSINFHHKVFSELLGNKLVPVNIREMRIVVLLHDFQIQRCDFLKAVFDNQRPFLGAA